ncbi:MAG TPA: metalloregulator ArsR/SmtB family transcription factor [Actinomycetales bacterium]|nr:metalloregulator ArsR/SmtB family transcription factor [Actinomycetales bacterium]
MPLRSRELTTPINEIKAELFKALAHPIRIRVLELLVDGERGVSDLLADTGAEASHLSQHLAVLRRAGVVTSRREGSAVYYRLAHDSIRALLADARTFLLAALDQTRVTLADLEGQS